jgi:hypothetical protein
MTTRPNATYAPFFLPAAALAAMLCASCAGVTPTEGQMPGEKLQGRYTCKGMGAVDLRFFDSTGMVQLTRAGRTLQLRQQRSGQVVIYSDGANSVRREGNAITVELAGGEPTRCVHSTGPN